MLHTLVGSDTLYVTLNRNKFDRPVMPLNALYVDFNSYFASVEQQLRPELRSKPIGVLPVMADTTCCIAASYEAKAFGVKTGTLVKEARKLCPDIQFVEARPAAYIEYHHRLVDVVESCTHVERTLSIDEMVCMLTGSQQKRENAVALAQRIKRAIAQHSGSQIRCSIGIAPNIFLAKVASDMQKPDGCVVIETTDLPDCLYGLDLRDLCGIGKRMEQRLNRHGISTVRELCTASRERLRLAWGGVEGERMHDKLRGMEMPERPSSRRSLGHSHVLPPELRSRDAALSVVHRLLQKAAMRLRSYGLVTASLRVKVKFTNRTDWEKEIPCASTCDTLQLIHALGQTWQEYPAGKCVPMAVGISFDKLSTPAEQPLSLFDDATPRHDKLSAVVDAMNLRYGKNTLYFGGAHQALSNAPMRIAFTHIPDTTLEGDK